MVGILGDNTQTHSRHRPQCTPQNPVGSRTQPWEVTHDSANLYLQGWLGVQNVAVEGIPTKTSKCNVRVYIRPNNSRTIVVNYYLLRSIWYTCISIFNHNFNFDWKTYNNMILSLLGTATKKIYFHKSNIYFDWLLSPREHTVHPHFGTQLRTDSDQHVTNLLAKRGSENLQRGLAWGSRVTHSAHGTKRPRPPPSSSGWSCVLLHRSHDTLKISLCIGDSSSEPSETVRRSNVWFTGNVNIQGVNDTFPLDQSGGCHRLSAHEANGCSCVYLHLLIFDMRVHPHPLACLLSMCA